MNVRVQLLERWDRIAVDVAPGTPVATLKRDALGAFGLAAVPPEDFVVKLRGWDVLGEQASIAESGARDGSTFLMTYRRRRPVR
jgi:hypothetical protein